jgi:glutathione S-transferase
MGSEEYKEIKGSGKLEFGQMPMLELDDGTRLCHGDAIFNYVCSSLCKDAL